MLDSIAHVVTTFTVLGAAVIDDVLGLVILAVVSALVTAGSIGADAVGIILAWPVLLRTCCGATRAAKRRRRGSPQAPHRDRVAVLRERGGSLHRSVAMMVALLLACGAVLLVAGGELLVRGAAQLAAAGVPSLVIGLTVVAFGTSAPELAVNRLHYLPQRTL